MTLSRIDRAAYHLFGCAYADLDPAQVAIVTAAMTPPEPDDHLGQLLARIANA